MTTHVDAAREAASRIEHIWDERALQWPLTSESTVVEVGGYIGRWALQIADRYAPRLYVFEPQLWACTACRALLGSRAVVLNYGLGEYDQDSAPMERWGTDGCSFVGPATVSNDWGEGTLREIKTAFTSLGIGTVDLMLINVEGYEYWLLPHMLRVGIHPLRLMVQFHTSVMPNPVSMAEIYEQLEQLGYRIAWSYGVVLTAWERTDYVRESILRS